MSAIWMNGLALSGLMPSADEWRGEGGGARMRYKQLEHVVFALENSLRGIVGDKSCLIGTFFCSGRTAAGAPGSCRGMAALTCHG